MSDEKYGVKASIPLDEHGMPDEAKMEKQGRRVMWNAGRRAAIIREKLFMDTLLGTPKTRAEISHELFPLHYDAAGRAIHQLDSAGVLVSHCPGDCCEDPPS